MAIDALLHFDVSPYVESENNYDVSSTNAPLTSTSKFGDYAANLQKVSGDNPEIYLDVEDTGGINNTLSWTFDLWTMGGDDSGTQYILRYRNSVYEVGIRLYRDDPNDRYVARVTDDSNTDYYLYADLATCSAESKTTFHHLGLVRDGGTLKFYVNGTLGDSDATFGASTEIKNFTDEGFYFEGLGNTEPLIVDEFCFRIGEVIDFASTGVPVLPYGDIDWSEMVHYFPMDSSVGSIEFEDFLKTGATLNSTYTEVSAVAGGKYSNCCEIDLTTTTPEITGSDLNEHEAITFWFKLKDGFPTSNLALLDLNTTSYEVVFIITPSGNIECMSGYGSISAPVAIPDDDDWHLCIVNFTDPDESDDLTIYLDGTAGVVTSDSGQSLNKFFGWAASGVDILIDDVRFYNNNILETERGYLEVLTEPYELSDTYMGGDATLPIPTVDGYIKNPDTIVGDTTFPIPTVDSTIYVDAVISGNAVFPISTVDGRFISETTIEGDATFPISTIDGMAYNGVDIVGSATFPVPTVDGYLDISNTSEHETVNFLSFPIREQTWQGDNEKVATPVGTLVEAHGGRLLIAIDNEVFFTEYGLPGLVDDLENRLRFGSRVLMILSVGAGVYISDEKDIYYCEGQNPKKFIRKKVLDFPAKEWCISDKLIDPSKLGLDTSTLSGLFMTSQGPFIGLPDGMVFSVYDKVYESSREYLTIAEHDGEIIASGSSGGLFIQGTVGGLGRKAVAEISDNYLSINHTDGVAYGAKADGLYKLDEDCSGGGFSATISSHDFNVSKTKKCRSLYFGIDTDSSFKVYTSVDDGAWVEYDATNVKTGKQRIKVPISHIQRGRYWSVKIESDDYFKLDHIRGVFIELSAGRYGV